MRRFVLDASVALAWFVDKNIDPYALHIQERLLREDRAVVPPFWRIEIVNGLVVSEKRGTLTRSDVTEALTKVETLLGDSIDYREEDISMGRLLATARQFRLTAYDAEYLETAISMQLPLATLDRQLKAAAAQASVELIS